MLRFMVTTYFVVDILIIKWVAFVNLIISGQKVFSIEGREALWLKGGAGVKHPRG